MRRTPMPARTSRLETRTPLQSRTRLTTRRVMDADERAAKAIVLARSGGVSEVTGRMVPVDWSHRIGRAAGGLWTADNGVHMGRLEHCWLTMPKNRVHAEAGGWVLRSWQTPAAKWPVYLPVHGGWVFLHLDGTITPAPWQPAPIRGPWEVWT